RRSGPGRCDARRWSAHPPPAATPPAAAQLRRRPAAALRARPVPGPAVTAPRRRVAAARPERATPARVLPQPAVPRRRVLQPAPLRAPGPSPGRPRRRTERLLQSLPRTAERAARGAPPRLHRAWRVAVAPAVAGRTALPAARRAVPLW